MSNTTQLPILNGEPHALIITRNMSFWHQYLSNSGHFLHAKDFGVHAQPRFVSLTKHGTESSIFISVNNLVVYRDAILDAIGSIEKIEYISNRYHVFAEELLDALHHALIDLTPDTWQTFQEQCRRFAGGLSITSIIGRVVPEVLIEKLSQKGYSEEQISDALAAITYPEDHTPLFDSQLDLFQIGKEIQQGSISVTDIEVRLEIWLSHYGFIPVNFCEEPWIIADAKKQLQEVMLSDCDTAYRTAVEHHKTIIAEGKQILSRLADEEISRLAKAVQVGTTLNEFRKNVFCRISLEYRPAFKEIAKRANLSDWRSCFYLKPEEMVQILKGELSDANPLVAERGIVGYTVIDSGDIVWLPEQQTKLLSDYISSLQGQSKETGETAAFVKGMIACKGKVSGVVKVILSSKDFHKFSAGDILVTTMTSVDFVPLMQMAAAFVTNEGGVTSHASIVAREMNKPCVIGTKNSTQVFKDGDVVEVDAFRGIVTKVS